jgi:hypothetical protein
MAISSREDEIVITGKMKKLKRTQSATSLFKSLSRNGPQGEQLDEFFPGEGLRKQWSFSFTTLSSIAVSSQ